jgi:hypothetical protein
MQVCRFEWYNPNFLYDQANNFNTDIFVQEKTLPGNFWDNVHIVYVCMSWKYALITI